VEENKNFSSDYDDYLLWLAELRTKESENKNGLRNQPPKKILFTLLASFMALIFLISLSLFLTKESELAGMILLILTLNIPTWLWFIHQAAFSGEDINSKWREKSIILLGIASSGSIGLLLLIFIVAIESSTIGTVGATMLLFCLFFTPNLAIFIWSIKQSNKMFHQYNSEVKDKLLELDDVSPAAKVFIVLGKVVVIFLWYAFLLLMVYLIAYGLPQYIYDYSDLISGREITLTVFFILSGSWAIFVSLPRNITKHIILAACLSIFVLPLVLMGTVDAGRGGNNKCCEIDPGIAITG
jgi:hypothetical protein